MSTRLDRRTLLRGAGAALGLPALECMLNGNGTAYADGSPLPRLFGVFFWGGGLPWTPLNDRKAKSTDLDVYTPGATGADWPMTPLLKPLEPYRSLVNVVTGYTTHTELPSGTPEIHSHGLAGIMTGDRISDEGRVPKDLVYRFARPTLDQVVARHPGFYPTNPFTRSLELGVSRLIHRPHSGWLAISASAPDAPNLPVREPLELYRHLFGRGPGPRADPSGVFQVRALDAVLADARALRARLGGGDRRRLDAHLEHVASIQNRLQRDAVSCAAVRPGDEPAVAGETDNVARLELMADMLVAALRCDLTRVFTLMFTNPATSIRINAQGQVMGPGAMPNHDPGIHGGHRDVVLGASLYHLTALSRLLGKLSSERDAIGTSLLDRACVLATSEYGSGYEHTTREFPVILAGKAGGALRTGLHVRKAGGNLSEVHVTVLRALGLARASDGFGFHGAHTREAVPGLLT
ncbi:MAG TPA: DUF1552 domain-containing protein [Myxococcaceae bacterium]|nr:DUF1552 domain-containing protein [Myxococcaceae bacterium]